MDNRNENSTETEQEQPQNGMQETNDKNFLSEGMKKWQDVCVEIADSVEEFCDAKKIAREFPVDINEIAEIRDMTVFYRDLNPVDAENTFAVVGNTLEWKMLDDSLSKVVSIDKNQDNNSKRYALAYEIGISMLSDRLGDMNVPKSFNYSVPILPADSKKFLAEIYAMCLLLPWRSLLEALDRYVKDGSHASPIDNIEWIDYLADCAKMPRYNLCIGYSYISKIISRKCQEDSQLAEQYSRILQR